MRTLAALLLLALLPALPVSAQTPQASRTGTDQSFLAAGDSVRIVVWRKPELSGDFVVAPDGTITHPLYRAVRVAGMPYAKAEESVRSFLTQFEANPQFVMEPLIHVAVSGYVTRPIVFAASPGTSVGEAVARAGGVDQQGARNKVRILRLTPSGQQSQFIVDLTDASGSAGTMPIRSGDQIIVDKRKSFFKDVMIPALGIIGSVASLGLLIDRVSRSNNNN
ncbi:MAG TPA: polysaccharide biosynthesis/export family protein [Gemmatimonadales bacterium]|nr:polysaccharide biosynthesis/export family protein [Gemmatimonadales bacterium]